MNELIVNADGTVTVVGNAATVADVIGEAVQGATTPAEYDADGNETKAEVVPDASTVAVEVTATQLKTNAWRLPKARVERLAEIRSERDVKLKGLDVEYQLADEGVHPDGLSKAQVAAKKVSLRDLPPTAKTHLDTLNNTDDITAYDPVS
jgi:hypothetical protein